LETAVASAPESIPLREELADAYRAAGRPVDEMTQLQALAVRDKDVSRQLTIARAEARGGQFAGALGTLRAALGGQPNDSRLLLAIGRVYLARAERNGDDPESVSRAIEVIEHALGGSAPRSEGLALYGRALFLSGDAGGAERILRDAVATSPVETEAFGYLADAAERLGHHIVARDALFNLDALQGDTVAAEVRAGRAARIGTLSLRAGEAAAAADHLTRAVKLGHDTPLTLGELAHARWLTGDAEGARELLAKALAADPRDPQLQRIARLVR
jgi:predicted Zn-dependent protease